VLARIVQERGAFTKPAWDPVVITCAAATINSLVVAGCCNCHRQSRIVVSALYTIGGPGYVFLMHKFVRPFLRRIGELHTSRENLNKSVVAIFLLCTDPFGLHQPKLSASMLFSGLSWLA
jgi:hypothetical protein